MFRERYLAGTNDEQLWVDMTVAIDTAGTPEALSKAYFNRAALSLAMGHADKALEDLEVGFQDQPVMYKLRGTAHLAVGEYHEARTDLLRAGTDDDVARMLTEVELLLADEDCITPYQVLGISATATDDEVRGAWRTCVRVSHPDKSREPSATSRFRKIQAAFDILRDPERRAKYDKDAFALE